MFVASLLTWLISPPAHLDHHRTTLAHSLTLASAAMVVTPRSAPVEATIALDCAGRRKAHSRNAGATPPALVALFDSFMARFRGKDIGLPQNHLVNACLHVHQVWRSDSSCRAPSRWGLVVRTATLRGDRSRVPFLRYRPSRPRLVVVARRHF
jgi:hypothetical protein